ncbi:MAG: signal peptidase I [Pseudolysinimonas sp.]|jgi:signal peptidase I|uniref:signal peptidase I n=1 Tax=Pseudolysinimonas sp. TaxID=2680009 RepID=UPI003C752F34
MTEQEAPLAREGTVPDQIDSASDADSAAGATDQTRARPKRKKLTGWRAFLRDVALILVAAIVISFLIKTFLIRSFYIPSQSMEDTLLINDRIIVNELVPNVMPIERGDIVVFRDPGGWLAPVPEVEQNPVVAAVDWLLSIIGLTAPDSNDHLIKRVIGLPGDVVECCNEFGQMSVNGVPLDEVGAYVLLPDGVTKVSRDDFEVTVPEDSLWVMGDNRYNSADSRYNQDGPTDGFVPFDHVVGRAIVVSWPIDRWTWLENYPIVFSGVDEGNGTPQPTPESTPSPSG